MNAPAYLVLLLAAAATAAGDNATDTKASLETLETSASATPKETLKTSATNTPTETLKTSASATPKEILKASATADPSKVEIVKQIRRLNDDGSYTIGYEADDGTFKIESRDVLGNVKGTFGYIDKDGEIKRVTYTSSNDAPVTAVPVTPTSSSSTTSSPTMIVRVNKTVSSSSSSTTRRPQLATVVYPTRTSYTTRGPPVQNILRRRTSTTTAIPTTVTETTTEKAEQSTSNILNLYKTKEDNVTKRTPKLKPVSSKDDLITKQTSTKIPHTVKPVYEHVTEKESEPKANTIRRELSNTSPNPHMISLQQSAGDDSTDVYGSHLSHGILRPLFTTTTPRPRLVPIHSLVAARQKIQQQYREIPVQEQETTIEASTGRVFDQENVVTSNPVPVVHIPAHKVDEERFYQQQLYRRPPASVHFRTNEYLKDNPGAPIPIGNQRPFLQFQNQHQQTVLEPQYVKEPEYVKHPPQQTKGSAPEAVTQAYEERPVPVTRIIPIAVDERGVPIQSYQRYVNVNPYRPTQAPVVLQPVQPINPVEEMNAISAPVSTRDLKRLLQILILRQNRLQALMDQIIAPGPPYQPLPLFREAQPRYEYDRYQRQYPEEDRYDYRYEPQYRQQEVYTNQVANYDNPQYDNQRYLPRRRLYTSTRPYDTAGSSSNRVEEPQEYLPPEIREALLLKMLMLAISPDFMPAPPRMTEMTTAAPAPRKQVRNVQILGEEGSMDEAKRNLRL